MKVLVVSNTPWSDDNSFGNSFSNIFSGIPDMQFANIYCRAGVPHNKLDMICFQITERSLLRNLMNKRVPAGKVVNQEESQNADIVPAVGFEQGRKMRWQVAFWARDMIWKMGHWWSDDLKRFIDDFNPDIIFQPVYYSNYLTEIALAVHRYSKKPMIGYISDDCYTLRQFNLSPLYWIDRFHKRKKVKAVIDQCDVLYVISDIQKEEYSKIFSIPCKILTKCADFSKECPHWSISEDELTMLFAGNIGSGRWKSLALIADAVEKLNQEGYKIRFDIYTPTPMTKEISRALKKRGTAVYEPIPYVEIISKQEKTDILVHVEGLSLKSRLAVHQSFSTKLVDFFEMGKCIFAVGTYDEASIRHLMDYDAAVVASDRQGVYQSLAELCSNPAMISEYGEKAYVCGRNNHSRAQMQKMLLEDIARIADGGEV